MSDFGSSSSSFSRKILHRCINRDWSGLPRNVLFDIMDKLTVIDDYVRFGGVCRSWRTIFIQDNSETKFNKHCSQPFLLIPIELTETAASETTTKTSLYSLSTNRVYNLHFQLTGNKSFRGSTHGWLVTMETKGVDNHHVQLQNPFLSQDRTIDLPTLDNLVQQHGNLNNDWGNYYLGKAVLSADPSSSRDFIVMAIMSQYHGLAFFKSGNTSWTSIGEWRQEWKQQLSFQDVIFFHKTKQFYAIRYNGQVLAIDFEGQGREPKLIQVVPPLRVCSFKSYLAEDLSSGDLLMVSRNITTGFVPQTRLKVFKLHPVNQHWIRMHNLGGKILFLGNNISMLRSSSDCPGCQPNSVYYTNDIISRSYGTQGRMPAYYDGIYNLIDGTNRPHYSPPAKNFLSYTKTLSSPIWLDPTVRVSTSMVL